DIHQVEPVRRGGHTGKFAITEFQNITNPVFRLLTITNRHQGTGNIAYHMMKKGVGLHIYYDKLSASGYRNPLQKPNGSPGLATGSAKRREVVLADQCLGCAMHPFGIQRAKRPAHLPTLNPRTNRMIVDHIPIAAVNRGKPGVKITLAVPGPVHRNIIRQRRVHSHDPGTKVSNRWRVKMRHLKTGMHAGVGSPRTHQVDRMICNTGRCPGKFCLHRTHTALLQLPAMEGLTVVLKDDGNPSVTNGVICGERLRREEQLLTRLLSTEKAKRRLNGRRLPR